VSDNGPIEIGDGLVLARDKFDVGLLTAQPEAALAFWSGARGLPVVLTMEPVPGVVQHKLGLQGAVLKVNGVAAGLAPHARLAGLRVLRTVDAGVADAVHARDPDGNVVELVPPGGALRSFGVHFAVSDEEATAHFYAEVLRLERIGDRTYDLAGADLSFSWSPDVLRGKQGGGAGYGYLTLQVMDVHEAHALLVRRGATEMQAPSDTAFAGGSSVSFVADPDGNRIEISQRPDLVAAARAREEGP
jgi:catechol 2,3-dioxygenase-like lactoylglutathione lyase family enzyme